MKFTLTYFIYALLAGICATTPLFAQQTTNTDMDYIRKSNAWLNIKNAAGLSHYTTENISSAELFFNKQDGGFRNYFQSDNSQDYGLRANSFTRLNPKVVLSGGFEYQNFKGKNMTGSAFIDPYQSPFDIVELDAANRGTKEAEFYNLNGAVSAEVSSKWSIGGKISYGAANFAKRKDLRHVNKLLTMDMNLGALYQLSKVIAVGASYNYDRRIESLTFKAFGNTDQQYLSLISFGSFYGHTELFGDYGYTSGQTTNPLRDIRQGGSMQLNLNFNKEVSLLNEFSYEDRKGFFGEDGSSSILLTRHNGSGFAYNGQLSVKADAIEHHLTLRGSYDFLANKRTIYRRESTIGGVNRIVYYGDRDVFSGETINAGLSYNLYLGVKNNRPTWAVNVSADYMGRDHSTYLYPFYRDQKINSYQVYGQLSRAYQKQQNAFTVGLGMGYGAGNGNMAFDGVAATPAAEHLPPAEMPQFLNQEYQYFTASRIKGNLMLKYARALQSNLGAYITLNYTHAYAGDVTFIGHHSYATNVSLGCNF